MIAGLILAAGSSTRLGQPKQLVKHHGKTLIKRLEAHLSACCDEVFVVLGHEPDLIKPEISQARLVYNPNWVQGMGSSLKAGVRALPNTCEAVLVSVCDQYLIPADHFDRLVVTYQQHKHPIIATSANDYLGVPAIFDAELFSDIQNISGDRGAKKIIRSHPQRHCIQCPEAIHDLDTPEDLARLQQTST